MRGRGLIAGSVLVVLFAAGCTRPAPEQRLREQLDALQAAIDARDAGAIEEVLAEDFVGNEGMDRQGARRLAAGTFLRYRAIGARLGPVRIDLQGEHRATAGFTALVSGGDGNLLPERGQVYQVTTGWRLDDGDWRIVSATWEPEL